MPLTENSMKPGDLVVLNNPWSDLHGGHCVIVSVNPHRSGSGGIMYDVLIGGGGIITTGDHSLIPVRDETDETR